MSPTSTLMNTPLADRLVFSRIGIENLAVITLLKEHRDDLSRHSPADSVHAFTPDAFLDPSVTLITSWDGDSLVGCGALKQHSNLDKPLGELKSMRTVDRYLRQGAAAAMLEELMRLAEQYKITHLALETGSNEAFAPARALYTRYGFTECDPFADYQLDPYSTFMSIELPSHTFS